MRVSLRFTAFTAASAVACILSVSSRASAAAPWVDREITLPRHDWAFDVGLGVASSPGPNGAGLNLEGAVGVTEDLEIGLRTGLRMGDGGRATQADDYGRLFDRQTFGTYGDVLADPEFRIRGKIVRTQAFEMGIEGRAFLPVEQGSRFGVMPGLPMRIHIGYSVRIDTGLFVPIIFAPAVDTHVSIPADFWFQISQKLWLGPMTGIVFHNPTNRADVSLGFGLGYQIASAVDFKTMFLFPAINNDAGARVFGAGAGFQFRIE